VGLDLERIRNKILYGEELTYKDIDNGVWRLPTLKETHIFMDYNDYYGLPANAHWTSFSGVVGGSFPSADAGFNAFLPAAGYREGYAFTTNNQQGGVMMQGYWGYYMSSAGSAMWFNDIYSETRASDTDGIAASVRCVRQ
jgi:hypothetical protein